MHSFRSYNVLNLKKKVFFSIPTAVAQFHNSGIIAKILELLELTYLYITYNSVIHKKILSSGEIFQVNDNYMKYH